MSSQGICKDRVHSFLRDFYAALNRNILGVNREFWTDGMVWRGNAGLGTKTSVDQFEEEIRKPFIRAFPDKVAEDDVFFIGDGYAASCGHQVATHAEDWLGIPATGKRTKIRYIDIWSIEDVDGRLRLAENWVSIDILGVLEQAGYDIGKVLKFVGSKPPEFFDEAE